MQLHPWIAVETMKQNQTLILVPGLMCDATVWQHQSASLSAICDVHVCDHGLSDSLGVMAERILDQAPPRFALAGHSMGGRVALEVMARAPERVSKLALLDTGYQALAPGEAEDKEKAGRYRLLDIAQRDGMAAMAADWSRGMVYPPRLADAELMQAIQSMIARAVVERFAAQIRALLQRPDRTALLASLRLPTLLLCGHDDSWSPLARHEDMKRLIAGSTLVAVPECGHMSTMERPEAVSAAMIDWMQS